MKSLKPIKTVLSLQAFHAEVSKGGYIVQRKYDGVFREIGLSFGGTSYVFLVEHVTRKSGFQGTADDNRILNSFGSFFVPLTLVSIGGQNLLTEPNKWRLEKMVDVLASVPGPIGKGSPFECPFIFPPRLYVWNPPSCFIPDGEGLVAHPADGPWGQMLCVKNRQDYFVRALAFPGGRLSVQVEETDESMNARQSSARAFGNIPISQKIACQIQPGMVLKITAAAVTAAGMFREARLCDDSPDSWCVKNV